MQIESIKIADYVKKTDDQASIFGEQVVKNNPVHNDNKEELKNISVDGTLYNKKGQSSRDILGDVKEAANIGISEKQEIDMISKAWGDEATEKLEDDGYNPMEADRETIVTIVDEIKLQLAKAGVDVEKLGGLSAAEIEAILPSYSQAKMMEAELGDDISLEAMKYLICNEMEPTLKNIYNAQFSAPAVNERSIANEDEIKNILDSMQNQLKTIIDQIGIDAKEEKEAADVCQVMVENDIPLTAKNLKYMMELENYQKPSSEQIDEAISNSILEGNLPEDAYLVEGYSVMDQAKALKEEIDAFDPNTLTDNSTKLQLEEIRLKMTIEASFVIVKNGFSVDTNDIKDIIHKLEMAEQQMLAERLGVVNQEKGGEKVSIYNDTMKYVADIYEMPLAMLGRIRDIESATIPQIHQIGISVKAEFEKMSMTYEAVGTEVRKDYGDSIQKAFQNVDDILNDLDLETSDSNQKAVRTLAYNQMEITKESVLNVKANNEMVARTFKNMTPMVVTEMIKRGENPLDLRMSDLNKITNDIKNQMGNESSEESFSKFLWKMEHTEGISKEDREAYIGIYRMLHQVTESDGAAVGALISQGSEVTLRNLMTAVRSGKKTGRDIKVDNNFGMTEEMIVKELSITQQVEKAFMINRCRDAKEAMTPAKMARFESEDEYMGMSVDNFATAMESMEDAESEKAYRNYIKEEVQKAFDTEEEVYHVLDKYDIPNSAQNLGAMEALLYNRNQVFKDLIRFEADDQGLDIEDIINQLIEKYGEDCKTPEEMAKAQEQLGDMAENALKNMLVDNETKALDLRGMKLIQTQISVMSTLASKEETYHLPIMIADETGNMTLKIVRGTKDKGLVSVAFSMETTGTVKSSFKYEDEKVKAEIDCEDDATRQVLAERAPMIAAIMQEKTGFSYAISFKWNKNVEVNDIYMDENPGFEITNDRSSQVQTSALYGIARGFISSLADIF